MTSERWAVPSGVKYPAVLLRADKWDDFTYKTMYQAEYYKQEDEKVSLGAVKVMKKGQGPSSSPTPLPTRNSTVSLDAAYCSLGQALSYYETLIDQLSSEQVNLYLTNMQDIAANPSRRIEFEEEPAFKTSLLREVGAQRALEDAPDLLAGKSLGTDFSFSFVSTVGGTQFRTNFMFGDMQTIPSRINAVIGYNGSGKTRLLMNLSHIAWGDHSHRKKSSAEFGSLHPSDVAFGRVVAISYSAFDTFKLPTGLKRNGIDSRAYVYCGLRRTQGDGSSEGSLKGPQEISQDIELALKRLKTNDRWKSLHRALEPLLHEPSFRTSPHTIDFGSDTSKWLPLFDRLSTGHKISLNIIVQLVAHLENKSLVLLDEPESHLHPPLLAALMKGVTEALDETNSYAIVATHSPVVLQEIAGRYVQVMRRNGDTTSIERPMSETFGENVGILTRSVFNLNNNQADHEGVLAQLAKSHGTSKINEVFPNGLSSQALGILMQYENETDLNFQL